MLLQDSLGGDAKALMFCNVAPAALHAGDTFSSLNFASKVCCAAGDLLRTVKVQHTASQLITGTVRSFVINREFNSSTFTRKCYCFHPGREAFACTALCRSATWC